MSNCHIFLYLSSINWNEIEVKNPMINQGKTTTTSQLECSEQFECPIQGNQ